MIKRLSNNLQSQARRIRFYQLRSCLCPLCNSSIYFDTKEDAYKCKNADCDFKQLKNKEQNIEIKDLNI